MCMNHNVEKLYLFGSATTEDFSENSDIDFLVKFKPFDLALYFENYTDFKYPPRQVVRGNRSSRRKNESRDKGDLFESYRSRPGKASK